MPKKTAYSYVRFSSAKQAKGSSLARQTEQTQAFCERNNLTLNPASYHDLGLSAWKGANRDIGALGQFVEAVKKGKIKAGSVLVVESLDRISRKTARKALRICEEIIELGITIATITPERFYDLEALDDAFSLIEMLFIMIRANEESEVKSHRVKEAWKKKLAKAEKGELITSRCPAWLEAKADGKGFKLVPERVKIVKYIFRMALEEGLGQRAIATRLNAEGVPNFGPGEAWGWAYVRLILTDGKVIGRLNSTTGRPPIEDYYPPVIQKADFERVQAATTSRRRKWSGRIGNNVANLLQGMVYDSDGNKYSVIKKKPDTPHRLTPLHQGKQQNITANYDQLEEIFLKFHQDLTAPEIDTEADDAAQLETELSQIESRIEALQKLLADPTSELPSVIQSLKTLENKRKTVARQLEEAKGASSTLRDTQKLIDTQTTEGRLRLRAAIRNLIDHTVITIEKDGWWVAVSLKIIYKTGSEKTLGFLSRRGEVLFYAGDSIAWRARTDGLNEWSGIPLTWNMESMRWLADALSENSA